LQALSGVFAKCKAEDQGKTTLKLSAHEHLLAKSLLADFGNSFFTAAAAAVLSRACSKSKSKIIRKEREFESHLQVQPQQLPENV